MNSNFALNYTVSWYVNDVLKRRGSSLTFFTSFPSSGQHTVKASITRGTNTYSATKVVNAIAPPATPEVSPTNPTQRVYPTGYDDAPVYWSPPGQAISFSTLNYDPAATYNWMSSFAPMYYTGSTYAITPPSNSSSGIFHIMCQATKSGLESEGSYVYLYVSSTYPTSGSLAMKKLVEQLDEFKRDGAKLKEMRKQLSDYSASKAASQTQAAQ
ncbi:MAG: hypothetical protein LBU97_00920 [Alistipes sp.]|jgi:hypothetical protein|nr:hypothetical protein [Alistipes sp.]